MEKIVRGDGSCNHIVVLNELTGAIDEIPGGQGYESGSSWSRGQAWALYGFALSYIHTREQKYLDCAKRIAHYFIANIVNTDYMPLCDFRQPAEPAIVDTTAAGIALCGMLEIAKHVGKHEKAMYEIPAIKMLQALDAKYADYDTNIDSIIHSGTEAYHNTKTRHVPIIYGDYYFIEGILRVLDRDFTIWGGPITADERENINLMKQAEQARKEAEKK
jgi:unsaturated chondroitin disaccharide hydrolase